MSYTVWIGKLLPTFRRVVMTESAATSRKLRYDTLVNVYEGCPESVHQFEYLEKQSCGLDVTWQPVRGELTARP